jgi:hypothetical protein
VLPQQTSFIGVLVQLRRVVTVIAGIAAFLAAAAPARADTHYGALTFPQDENAQPVSWDYWWGSASLVTTSGNRYLVGMAYTSIDGDTTAGYQVFPLQGPYKGQSLLTMDGPTNWGHPSQPAGRFLERWTNNVPGTPQRLDLSSLDTSNHLKVIDRWERVSLSRSAYHLNVDQDQAKVHPTGKLIPLHLDLRAIMRNPPLLAGGTGRWFYGVPEDFHYPSRGYQYMQLARRLAGTLSFPQPDGSMVNETVDPSRSTLFMIHESDPFEDNPTGLGIAASTQVNLRYAQYYNLQWPWELVFADLGNGAQLMVDLQAYHDTPNGLTHPVKPQMPTYRVLATLRLPGGKSVPMNSRLHAEHLEYRHLDTIVGAWTNETNSLVTQTWRLRLSFPGGTVPDASGKPTYVPPFDLGFVPPFAKNEPQADPQGNRMTQRIPFDVTGSYADCPVHGYAWSEMLDNWYGHEQSDPWYTGGSLPAVPSRCGDPVPPPPSGTPGNLNPAPQPATPNLGEESCGAKNPGTSTCTYDATHNGALGGDASQPGGWTATITRPGQSDPIVITSHGGWEQYPCGTIRPGDHVELTAQPGSEVSAGDPVVCY